MIWKKAVERVCFVVRDFNWWRFLSQLLSVIHAVILTHDIRTQDWCTRPVVSTHAAWHQVVPICSERWCTEATEATGTHCYNPVVPAYPVWAYYAHGRQRICEEDPVSLPSGRLEKTTRSSPYHVAQHRPTGSATTPPYAPWSSRFGSAPPSVEDDVDVWRYVILCQKRRRRLMSCWLVVRAYVLRQSSWWIKLSFSTDAGLGQCHSVSDGARKPSQTGNVQGGPNYNTPAVNLGHPVGRHYKLG